MFTHAICRRPGPDAAQGLTTASLGTPDHGLLLQQHDEYVSALRQLGLGVEVLDALPGFPDAYFVEDVAVLVPALAVLTRPGAASRQGEVAAMEQALSRRMPVAHIQAPGTLDGGDVLIMGQRVFVGLSARSNAAGASQLGELLQPLGYQLVTVPVGDGLHLKSSVNTLGEDTVLVTESFADCEALRGYHKVIVPAGEEHAANTLLINGTLLHPRGYPETRVRLAALGVPVLEIDTSEICKMDGGLSCLSLRF